MQRTRLSTVIDTLGRRFGSWVLNPWRRISLVIISLLFGNFFGIAISSIAGQAAEYDVVVAAILLVLVEIASAIIYRRRLPPETRRPLGLEMLNSFKIGLTYALFVEAFKLGS